jgi:membrane fusion protein (multidrug efflux system)
VTRPAQRLPSLLAVPLVLAACSSHERAVATRAPPPAIPVHTARVREVRWAIGEEIIGTVKAARTATVASTLIGTVADVRVALGDRVRAGDVLVRLSAHEIDARVQQAEAAHVQAQLEHERSVTLRQGGAISQAQADNSLAQFRIAEAARLEARTMADHTVIRAPFAGIVGAKLVEVGDVATPGRPLVVIEAAGLLRFEAAVPEAATQTLDRGETLAVSIDGVTTPVQGTIAEISPSADPATRSLLVKLDLPPGTPAHPGTFGRVASTLGYRAAVAVPQGGLVRRGQLDELFVVEHGAARLRLVRVGREHEGLVELLAGVRAGETIALAETTELSDGQPVKELP